MKTRNRTGVLLIGTVCGTLAAQPLPGPIDPGQLGRELRQPPSPRVQPELPAPQPLPPQTAQPQGPAFRVNAVRVEGATVFDAEALRATYAELIGRSVHIDDLERVADRMTVQYRNAGYLLAKVIVPEQILTDGSVTLRVFEGYVDSAVYQGANIPDVVRNYVQKITAARPLTAAVLERYLLLINDIPGVTAHAALAQSPRTVGAAELTLVASVQRLAGDASIDNRLTRSLGPARVSGSVQLANTFYSQEVLRARVIEGVTNRVSIGSLGWEQAWGTEGLKTSATFSAVRTRPDLALAQTSSSSNVDLGVAYPLIRARSRNLYLRTTFSALNSRAEVEGGGVLFEDRVRVLRLGANGDLADAAGGVNLVDLEVSHGLGGDIGLVPSRAGVNTHFNKLTLFASRLQTLTPRTSVLLAFNGQYSGSTLYSSEQFGAGGEVFLRGFDPSELIGDRGWAVKLEVRHVPMADLMAYAFYDRAHVENASAEQPVLGGASAGAFGIGLRFVRGRISSYVEVAQPLARDVAARGDRHVRLFGGLRYAF